MVDYRDYTARAMVCLSRNLVLRKQFRVALRCQAEISVDAGVAPLGILLVGDACTEPLQVRGKVGIHTPTQSLSLHTVSSERVFVLKKENAKQMKTRVLKTVCL